MIEIMLKSGFDHIYTEKKSYGALEGEQSCAGGFAAILTLLQ